MYAAKFCFLDDSVAAAPVVLACVRLNQVALPRSIHYHFAGCLEQLKKIAYSKKNFYHFVKDGSNGRHES